MQFTDKVMPTQSDEVFEPDATTGNYAYMVDNQGFITSRPADFYIYGFMPDGSPVAPLSKDNFASQIKSGFEVLNLNMVEFMDANMPKDCARSGAGQSGHTGI